MIQVKKIILAVVAVCMQLICFVQIQHVEPLNWWVGMNDPALQLLINGNAVGNTTPAVNYPGVTIKNVSKGDSENCRHDGACPQHLWSPLTFICCSKPPQTVSYDRVRVFIPRLAFKQLDAAIGWPVLAFKANLTRFKSF